MGIKNNPCENCIKSDVCTEYQEELATIVQEIEARLRNKIFSACIYCPRRVTSWGDVDIKLEGDNGSDGDKTGAASGGGADGVGVRECVPVDGCGYAD